MNGSEKLWTLRGGGYTIGLAHDDQRSRPPQFQIPTEDWTRGAMCAQVDPELFWPGKGHEGQAQAAKAKKVCESCTVRLKCLAYALRRDEQDGIWGGLSPRQRRALKRRMAAEKEAVSA